MFGAPLDVLQAPMAGAQDIELAVAVARAGGLGALPCAMLSAETVRAQVSDFRARAPGQPLNLNFFSHTMPEPDPAAQMRWLERLAPYYRELGLDPAAPHPAGATRTPFGEAQCASVEELKPEVVSFHFGLPPPALLERVKRTGAKVIASATTVEEARWLAERGCDAIIAQGLEAGGHRGMFLSTDPTTQSGTLALVPQVVDAVKVPVIAAGGISDARAAKAARALGAAAVQAGTAYLRCPEARISPTFQTALAAARDDGTQVTNLFSGRPARGLVNRLMRELGAMSPLPPAFPLASAALAPLRAAAEAKGLGDFSALWAGQAAHLARAVSATEVTRALAGV